MTSQSPRIYIYKITFLEVPYYYYGVHKEKRFDEYYMGSPKTHKWCWELYTPKKQILQFFDFTDEGWLEAQEVERKLIKPFYNTDKWCLNENCEGIMSLSQKSKAGKIGGKNAQKTLRKNKLGIYALTPEQMIENGRRTGKKTYEEKTGVHGRTKEQMIENGKIGGKKAKEMGVGVHGRTKEQIIKDGKKGGSISGKKTKELGIGIWGRTKEKHTEDSKKATQRARELGVGIYGMSKEKRSENGKKVASQKWMCLETGFISNAGALTIYQRNRNIETSKRKRIE
tara:strand:+ start:183 stop:1034 length:852 start_codon:yes stop_codon:yes gene_type:complete